ncbi:MAG: hypothetical protein WKG01_39575 [Kofleriaceae bacterium]
MPHHVGSDISVKQFGYTDDAAGRRLTFPHAESHGAQGRSGPVTYGAGDLILKGLEGRLDTLRWTAEAASLGKAWLKDDSGRIDMHVERIEMPRGIMLTRADRGVEIMSSHVSLQEMKLTIKGPFQGTDTLTEQAMEKAMLATQVGAQLRQDKLRFLDSLSGKIALTVKVVLDLPVLGRRTLDQQLKVPIKEGSLDFRKLNDSLDWLEGAFLDIKHDNDKLAVTWKVPIVGSSRDLVAWKLDQDAATLASFGRVPVRSLADFRLKKSAEPSKPSKNDKSKLVKSMSLDAIDIALSLLAPRSVEAGGGTIMFGGDDQPGMVDMAVRGGIHDTRAGSIKGNIGSIDTTLKDVRMGPVKLTADRLHFDGLDALEVEFDGFTPKCVTVVIHQVTATNLALQVGGADA